MNFFLDKSLGDTASDVISDSSGVGTSQSDTTNSLSIPGTTVVCVESYNSGILGHLNINQGDILEGIWHRLLYLLSVVISPHSVLHISCSLIRPIKKGKTSDRWFLFFSFEVTRDQNSYNSIQKKEECSPFYRCTFVSWTVTGATDCGLLEGVLRGQGTGLFPAHCVQEVRLRHTNIPLGPQPSRDGRNPRVLGRRESQHKYFATAPRLKKPWEPLYSPLYSSFLPYFFFFSNNPIVPFFTESRPSLAQWCCIVRGRVSDSCYGAPRRPRLWWSWRHRPDTLPCSTWTTSIKEEWRIWPVFEKAITLSK